jgi:hypothetical protein
VTANDESIETTADRVVIFRRLDSSRRYSHRIREWKIGHRYPILRLE